MDIRKIGDLCTITKRSMKPQKGVTYTLYSLPSYDADETPEVLDGDEILSSKFILTQNTILYNKLNVHFKRVWNIKELCTENNICSTEFFPLKVKTTEVSQDYLYYILRSEALTQAMYGARRGTSGSQQRIAPETLLNYEVPVFSLQDQNKIAGFLRDIDDRIRINRKIKDNLFQQARILYQSWFIEYAPFGGNAPKDWKTATLGEIATIKTKSFSPDKNPDVVVEHYSIPAYDSLHYPVFERASKIKSNKYVLTKNSIMISKLNPDTKRIWRPLCVSENSVCSTEFIVYEANIKDYKDYLYSIIDSVPFQRYMCAHASGSTNSRQRVTPKSTLDFEIVIPEDVMIKEFCKLATPLYDMAYLRDAENQCLIQCRDSLLPRLISGDLDIAALEY